MKEINLTQGRVAKVDDIDYEWLSEMGKWQFDRYAYCTRGVKGKRKSVRMHSLIMNTPKGMVTDHINGDKLDNRRENLRVVSQSANAINRHVPPGSSTGLYGVYWDNSKRKWRAMIGKTIIGRYETPESAAVAYNEYVTDKGWLAPLNEGVVR